MATTGGRSPGKRRPGSSRATRTGSCRSAYARAMLSRSSRRAGSSGRSSTSRSARSARSARPSMQTARRRRPATSSSTPSRLGCSARTRRSAPRSSRCAAGCRGCGTCSHSPTSRISRRGDARTQPSTRMRCARRPRRWRRTTSSPTSTRPGRPGRLRHLSGAYVGYAIAFLPDPLQAAAALPQVKPTVFPSVPRVYEKVHTAVLAKFDAETGAKRKLIDWALRVGRRVSVLRRAGKPVPRGLALQHRLADRLVYAKVKERLGGRLRLAISGGAPLSPEIAEFFHAIDILLVEGYGLTECTTAASTNTHEAYRFGTVGRALPGTEVKLAEDGELLIRSETVFQGYYKEPEATAEVLGEDGWLRSGDIAEIDEDGFITITDRKKDIIVTAGGKNVAPQNLENDLKSSKFVSQAMVVGDRQPYIAALITLDPEALPAWAADQGLPMDMAVLAEREEVRELVQGIVDGVNADRSRYEQIKRFVILPRDFTMDDDELTPTLKLKRRVVARHFGTELGELYEGETLNQAAGI